MSLTYFHCKLLIVIDNALTNFNGMSFPNPMDLRFMREPFSIRSFPSRFLQVEFQITGLLITFHLIGKQRVFNKSQGKRFLSALKNGDYSTITKAFSYAIFRFLGLLFAIPLVLFLWIMKPIFWLKVSRLHSERIGHLALNTDLFLRQRQLGIHSEVPFYFFISNPNNLANRQLLEMWKRVIPVYESRILCWMYQGMLPILKRTPFSQDLPIDSNEYFEFNNANTSLHFTPKEIEKGRSLLHQLNVDLDKDEFVCIFARDDAFLKQTATYNNWDYHNVRNADIDNLVETAKYLVEKGFVVIRVGSIVKKPINFSHERMIDYPYTGHQSDFMDIFLLANCKFVISSGTSGMTDLATIFDRPLLAVNIAEFWYAPISKSSIYIPKKYKYSKTNEYLRFKDALKLESFLRDLAALGLEIEDNNPQDILEAAQEMLARVENKFSYSPESKRLIQAYHKLWGESGIKGSPSKTPIGIAWLKKNQGLYF
jgi:putative glycosyltransferase (TIGR04372 family)